MLPKTPAEDDRCKTPARPENAHHRARAHRKPMIVRSPSRTSGHSPYVAIGDVARVVASGRGASGGRLAKPPYLPPAPEAGWDSRKTGSAAIECNFMVTRLLQVANFVRTYVWGAVAGICLA